MRAYLGLAAGLLLAACSNGASRDAAASASAADTAAPDPLVLVPEGFPANSDGDAWTVDLDQGRIQRQTMFYWRERPSQLGGLSHTPPSATFKLDRTADSVTAVRYEATEVVAGRPPRHVVVQLDHIPDDPALAWWHQIGVDGTVTVSTPGAADEVVSIVSGHPCDWSDACLVRN